MVRGRRPRELWARKRRVTPEIANSALVGVGRLPCPGRAWCQRLGKKGLYTNVVFPHKSGPEEFANPACGRKSTPPVGLRFVARSRNQRASHGCRTPSPTQGLIQTQSGSESTASDPVRRSPEETPVNSTASTVHATRPGSLSGGGREKRRASCRKNKATTEISISH